MCLRLATHLENLVVDALEGLHDHPVDDALHDRVKQTVDDRGDCLGLEYAQTPSVT